VNLASRITDFSTPGSVVVSKELHDAIEEAGDDGAYRWSNVGKKKLKGIKGQCELYRVRRAESGDGDSDSDSDDG